MTERPVVIRMSDVVRDACDREGVVIEQARHAWAWSLDAATDDSACGWRITVLLCDGREAVYKPHELFLLTPNP